MRRFKYSHRFHAKMQNRSHGLGPQTWPGHGTSQLQWVLFSYRLPLFFAILSSLARATMCWGIFVSPSTQERRVHVLRSAGALSGIHWSNTKKGVCSCVVTVAPWTDRTMACLLGCGLPGRGPRSDSMQPEFSSEHATSLRWWCAGGICWDAWPCWSHAHGRKRGSEAGALRESEGPGQEAEARVSCGPVQPFLHSWLRCHGAPCIFQRKVFAFPECCWLVVRNRLEMAAHGPKRRRTPMV